MTHWEQKLVCSPVASCGVPSTRSAASGLEERSPLPCHECGRCGSDPFNLQTLLSRGRSSRAPCVFRFVLKCLSLFGAVLGAGFSFGTRPLWCCTLCGCSVGAELVAGALLGAACPAPLGAGLPGAGEPRRGALEAEPGGLLEGARLNGAELALVFLSRGAGSIPEVLARTGMVLGGCLR